MEKSADLLFLFENKSTSTLPTINRTGVQSFQGVFILVSLSAIHGTMSSKFHEILAIASVPGKLSHTHFFHFQVF